MNKVLLYPSIEAEDAIAGLFDNGSPILVEVRFPRQGTSPDWYLCDEGQWERLLERLGPGVELHISGVWDLKGPREICLRK